MPLPTPALGLVISYAYLWRSEHQVGREEGTKDRPCAIVLVTRDSDGETFVTVAPITHRSPADPNVALEIPPAVRRHLGLDRERSWVVLDEVNEFAWPGYDLRPVPGRRDEYAFGFLPPRLFNQIVRRIAELRRSGRGSTTPRS